MTESRIPAVRQIGATLWAREVTPLRRFLRTETGSAAFLLGATVAALAWVNISARSYESFWHTTLSVHLGHLGLSQDLHGWVNSGLMTFFFLIVAVEARREFDMGELRERSRLALPLAAGLGGMIVPVLIYLAFTAGHRSAHGWGVAMSTDTAFALGALALVGPGLPDRVRTYLLTFSVVDDVASIVVIAVVYSGQVHVMPLVIGVLLLAFEALLRFRGVRFGPLHLLIGVAAWIAVYESGLDPVTVGLVMGLLAYARPAARSDLEQATDLFRLFREQPTAELARSASEGVQAALSPNDTLEARFHPWTSYVIVPLFALANADIVITGSFLAKAYTSGVTLGIIVAYVVGKPLGTGLGAILVTKFTRGRVRPPIGWAAVAGTGAIAGVGFTVSLLIASLAFTGDTLQEAKLGVLSAVLVASGLSWAVFKVVAKLPKRLKLLALLGTADSITDLAVAVDPRRDHLRGPAASPVTVVEYGDFECPYCGQAEPVVRKLLGNFGDVRYVWRHLPLTDVHPHAQLAAEGAEAAAVQEAFWPMHDLLLDHQGALTARDLLEYASRLDLDLNQFRSDLRTHNGASHVAEDVDSADLSGVSGTPTFFINGMRHYGAYDIDSLTIAVRTARGRALLGEPPVASHAEEPVLAQPVPAGEPEPVPEPELPGPGSLVSQHWSASPGRLARSPSVVAALGVVFALDVHRGLFGSGRARVDPDVPGDQVRFGVGVRALVLGDQPPGPGVGLVGLLEVLVLAVGLFVLGFRLGVGVDVGYLLGQQLVEGFTLFFLFLGGAEPVRAVVAVGREDAGVERIRGGTAFQ